MKIPTEAAERIAAKLSANTRRINENGMFAVRSAGSYVVRKKAGYRKASFIGGEELRFSDAYVGKSKNVILVFAPLAPVDYLCVEFDLKNQSLVGGFEGALTKFLGMSVEDYVTGYSELFREKEAEAAEKLKLENYGTSWGSFA